MMRAPASGFLRAVLLAQRHQPGHLLLGEPDLLAAELGERQVLHLVRLAAGGFRGGERMQSSRSAVAICLSPCMRADHERVMCRRGSALVATLRSGCDEQPRALRSRIRRQRDDPDVVEPALVEHSPHVLVGEAEPHVAHLLPVALAIVRQHVDDEQRGRRGLSTRATSASARSGSGTWCSTSISVAASSRASSIGSASSSPRRSSTLSKPLQPLPRRLQHRGRGVDRDDAARRTARARRSPGRCRSRDRRRSTRESASAAKRGEMEALAEQLVAQAIPLAGRRGEELLRLGAPLGERRLQRGADPAPRPASARPARGPAATAAAPTRRARRASSCRGCSCLRRAPRSSRCRPAPSGGG